MESSSFAVIRPCKAVSLSSWASRPQRRWVGCALLGLEEMGRA